MDKQKPQKKERKLTFALIRPVIRFVAWAGFGASTKTYRQKGPYLVLANHSSVVDAMLVGVAFREPLHVVASAATINGSAAGHVLRAIADPIVINKTAMDLQAIRTMFAEAKMGHSIALFPEGTITVDGSPSPVDVSVAKLAKQLRLPIALYRIEGGYFRKPKWARHMRRSRIRGRLVEVISPEEATAMPLEDLYARIMAVVGYDPFTQPNDLPTPHAKRMAEGIERLVYYCPTCGEKGDFVAKGNTFRCSHCGAQYAIDERCRLDKGPANTAEWNKWQKALALERVDVETFAVEGELWDIVQQKVVDSGMLTVRADGLTLGERTIPYADIAGAALYAYNKILLTVDGVDYRFAPHDDNANVLPLIEVMQYRMKR